ncbi:peptidoglycan DD-metalloendopeptidase family protein [Glaciecola sp. MH2013]|uniref:murein hydrolase activator EnvC family protein n=1 Tax=Glaciecola sp. MH2013 TaxID=2785524 RepID=UPI00189DCED9|nr:peptidoglycan DD-metalloendopeptidase family protein [Glaciecola sp. MH2013]MBF7073807.1 peptidoglycan DD-metalloendopeptidase family protein [Glaciecola sp. MH2013]
MRSLKFFMLVAAFLGAASLSCSNALARQSDLEAIQKQIRQTQSQLNKKLASSERLQQELKLAELEIAKTATLLNQTDRSLAKTQEEKVNTQAEKKRVEKILSLQQEQLGGQLRAAFMAGDYDFAKMFFNQDDAGRFERVITYYQYLNKARQNEIGKFKALVAELESINTKLGKQELELQGLLLTQKQQSGQLREQQRSRHVKLQALEKQIETDTARVNQLQQEERSLMNTIEQAEIDARARDEVREQAKSVELNGLAKFKGKLRKPAAGKVNKLFGKRRQGQVRWKGVVINSAEGSAVQAVQDGKVLYADWLKGFGLVTIVDHGNGYMTVYGRNQALLKQAGDVVIEGETIGLVGSSGGQSSPGLYFEIRLKGKALNPSSWLS